MDDFIKNYVINLILTFFPVVVYIYLLIIWDSFKLVKIKYLFFIFIGGGLSAITAYFLNNSLMDLLQLSYNNYALTLSPFIEESCKILVFLFFIRKQKLHFLVDSCIYGFSIGLGFAFFENNYFLFNGFSQSPGLWAVRGFGTALSHGGASAVFVMVFFYLSDSFKYRFYQLLFIALFFSGIFHLLNNFTLLNKPYFSVLYLVFSVPSIIIYLFYRENYKMNLWINEEFDSEIELLKMFKSGKFAHTKIGRHFLKVKKNFDRETVFDMICYIQLSIEYSLKRKTGMILSDAEMNHELNEEFYKFEKELKYLKKNIGKAAFLTIKPFLPKLH